MLPPDVELVRAQVPGREDHVSRAACTTVRDMLPELIDAIMSLETLPFALYGHSMGAIVAFELARELGRLGAPPPAVLFVSGRRAPHLPLSHAPLYTLDEPSLLTYLRGMGGVDERLLAREAWRIAYLPTLRADLQVSDAYVYVPRPPLTIPICAFRGREDGSVTADQAAGWGEHTSGAFVFRTLPGRHFFDREGRDTLLRIIADHMEGIRHARVHGGPEMAPPSIVEPLRGATCR